MTDEQIFAMYMASCLSGSDAVTAEQAFSVAEQALALHRKKFPLPVAKQVTARDYDNYTREQRLGLEP